MQFTLDYLDHFAALSNFENVRESIRDDFERNLASFLHSHNIAFHTSEAIAAAVYARMSDQGLKYHTPLHVLTIFQFANKHNIALADWEHLTTSVKIMIFGCE